MYQMKNRTSERKNQLKVMKKSRFANSGAKRTYPYLISISGAKRT
jgi:hypothetical protein